MEEEFDYSVLNIRPGMAFSLRELKSRLHAMDIPMDPNIREKKYYVDLYNKAIKDDNNKDKIFGSLFKDNNPNYQGELPYKRSYANNENEYIPNYVKEKTKKVEEKRMQRIPESEEGDVNMHYVQSSQRRRENIINEDTYQRQVNEFSRSNPFNYQKNNESELNRKNKIYESNRQLSNDEGYNRRVNQRQSTITQKSFNLNQRTPNQFNTEQSNKQYEQKNVRKENPLPSDRAIKGSSTSNFSWKTNPNPINCQTKEKNNTTLFEFERGPIQECQETLNQKIVSNFQNNYKSLNGGIPPERSNLTSAEWNKQNYRIPPKSRNNTDDFLIIEKNDSHSSLLYGLLFALFAIGAIACGYYFIIKKSSLISKLESMGEFVKNPRKFMIHLFIKQMFSMGRQFILEHIFYSIPLFILGITIEMMRRRFNRNKQIEIIFREITEKLKSMADTEDEENENTGISEREIIETYSKRYNVSFENFNRDYMKILRQKRKEHINLKLYESYYNGQRQLFWQWSNK